MAFFTTLKPQRVRLMEYRTNGVGRIDKEAGIIFGCRILGKESKNGRTYSDRAMADATRMYEGVKVNIDHPPDRQQERGFGDGFGELRNIRREGDAVIGDLHYVRSHPMAPMIVEYAERFPRQFGLSHHADGRVSRQGGKVIVESVEEVHSVDIVGVPATNRGLFESATNSKGKTMLTTTQRAAVDAAVRRTLREMDVGMTPGDGSDENKALTMADLSEDEAAIIAVIRSDATPAAKWDQVQAMLEKLIGSSTDVAPNTDPALVKEGYRSPLAGGLAHGFTPIVPKPAIKPVYAGKAHLRESVGVTLPAGRINVRAGLDR